MPTKRALIRAACPPKRYKIESCVGIAPQRKAVYIEVAYFFTKKTACNLFL